MSKFSRDKTREKQNTFNRLVYVGIIKLNKPPYDLEAASRPLAEYLDKKFPRQYSRYDPRRLIFTGKLKRTPEANIEAMAYISAAWYAWVIQSKAIWHFNRTSLNGIIYLDNTFIPRLLKAVAIGRMKAFLNKLDEGKYFPEFDVAEAKSTLIRAYQE